jgi:hypothetical protein
MLKKFLSLSFIILLGITGAYYFVNKEKISDIGSFIQLANEDISMFQKNRSKTPDIIIETVETSSKYPSFASVEEINWTPDRIDKMLNQEEHAEADYMGLFYFGNFDGLSKYSQLYSQARDQEVDGIVKAMDETAYLFEDMEKEMKKFRGLFDWYALKILALEPKGIKDSSNQWTLLDLLADIQATALNNSMKREVMKTLADELRFMDHDAEWGFLQQMKYSMLFNSLDVYSTEIKTLTKNFAILYAFLEEDSLPIWDEINSELDESLTPLLKEVQLTQQKIAFNTGSLLREAKNLRTADYHYSQEILRGMNQEIPQLQKTLNEYQADSVIDEEVLEGMKEYLGVVKGSSQGLEKFLNAFDKDKLAPAPKESDSFAWVQKARAIDVLDSAFQWLDSTVDTVSSELDILSDTVSMTVDDIMNPSESENIQNLKDKGLEAAGTFVETSWEVTKEAMSNSLEVLSDSPIGQTAKDLGEGAKSISLGVGVLLDYTDKSMESALDLGMGIYYGDRPSDIYNEISSNFAEVAENFKNGTSGSEIYQTATDYADSIEKGAGYLAKEGSKYVIPDSVDNYLGASDKLGWVASTTANFFTGFPKNVYQSLDGTKSDAERLGGLAGIAISMVGGGNSAATTSQIIGNGAKLTGNGMKSVFTKVITSETGKKIIPGGMQKIIETKLKKEFKEGIGEATETLLEKSWGNFVQGSKNGYGFVKDNLGKNVPDAFKNQFNPDINKLKTILGMGDDTGFKAFVGYLDNLAGNVVDDEIKAGLIAGFEGMGIGDKKEILDDWKEAFGEDIKEKLDQAEERDNPSTQESDDSSEKTDEGSSTDNSQGSTTDNSSIPTSTSDTTTSPDTAANNTQDGCPSGTFLHKNGYCQGSLDDVFGINTDSVDSSDSTNPPVSSPGLAGSYREDFTHSQNQSHTEQSITIDISATSNGYITIDVTDDKYHTASCNISINTSFTATVAGIGGGSGTGSLKTQSCTGEIGAGGEIYLSGPITGTAQVEGQMVPISETVSISGKISGNTMKGIISIPRGEDIPFGE